MPGPYAQRLTTEDVQPVATIDGNFTVSRSEGTVR
jgi:hypothetical protein